MRLEHEIVARLLGEAGELDPAQFVDDFFKEHTAYQAHPRGVEEERILRAVKVLGKYYLVIWDTYAVDDQHGHSHLGYRFVGPGGVVLFQGTDLGIPRGVAVDSDEVIDSLLGFITMCPGDTDDEYFENYTPKQMEFAEGDDAESIKMALDPEGIGDGRPYVDLEERE
jgi:hypothetical protein